MPMKNGFEVFDFKEEDEISELAAEKYLNKLKNPNLDDPATLKYQFLECGTFIRKEKFLFILFIVFHFFNKFV